MAQDQNESQKQVGSKVASDEPVDGRREAIKKIGKYTAFTAPILLGMISRPARAS